MVESASVSNSDGTLTISPTLGPVVASLALGHANTWTVAQTFNLGLTIASGHSLTNTGVSDLAAERGPWSARIDRHSLRRGRNDGRCKWKLQRQIPTSTAQLQRQDRTEEM